MDISTTEPRLGNDDAAENNLTRTITTLIDIEMTSDLNVEVNNTNPILSTDRKWAIRFKAGGMVTIVLGMRNYGRGWFSGYFANLAAVRLGIPLRRIRLYYGANHPAVLETPVPHRLAFSCDDVGPVVAAATDVIEAMCDQVIEKGRSAFAAMAGVGPGLVGFDRPTGRLFVLVQAPRPRPQSRRARW